MDLNPYRFSFVSAGHGENLALGQTAAEISSYSNTGPGYAVDGDYVTIQHTNYRNTAFQWWYVDLGVPKTIGLVVIWNRPIPSLCKYTIGQ